MYKYVITKAANGSEIYVNLIRSAAGDYISRHPHIIDLIKEVMEKAKPAGQSISIEKEMGRTIGNTNIVETTEKDTIFYAMATKKQIYSRYVKNRNPMPCSKLTIFLEKDEDGGYEVNDTWVGQCTPPFPDSENVSEASQVFWQHHALANKSQLVQSKTVTPNRPY